MRRALYRLVLLNLGIFLVTMLAILLARQVVDPENTPYEEIRRAMAASLDLDDPRVLERQVDRLGEQVDARLSVYSASGELLASSIDPPLPMESPDLGLFGGFVDVVDDAGRVRARVVMSPRLASVARQFSRDMLLVSAVVCVLALLVVIWATRRASAPLEVLVDAARRLGRGELDARAGLERDDEIGEVGRAFDEMAARMSLLMRSQRELLANVSHEFRTPLARMRVVSEMLADGDDVRELLPELDTDIAELERLVEAVLEAARLDLEAGVARRGEGPGRSEDVVTGRELVERIAARFKLAHAERRVDMDLGADELPSLRVDLDALLRAFDNLMQNAHHYSPVDRPIGVRARAEADALVVEIIDRGIGIEPDDLPLVFTPFFRADRSRARHTGGLGLGLATSKAIVEAEGGELSARSVVGEGSCFCVRLPAGG